MKAHLTNADSVLSIIYMANDAGIIQIVRHRRLKQTLMLQSQTQMLNFYASKGLNITVFPNIAPIQAGFGIARITDTLCLKGTSWFSSCLHVLVSRSSPSRQQWTPPLQLAGCCCRLGLVFHTPKKKKKKNTSHLAQIIRSICQKWDAAQCFNSFKPIVMLHRLKDCILYQAEAGFGNKIEDSSIIFCFFP